MDSIKSFKGYGKVDSAEDREFQKKTRRRLILIGVSSGILLVIVVGALVGVVVSKHGGGNDGHSSTPAISTSNSIKAICSVTRYPESCFTSISSVKGSNLTNDPEELFKIGLNVAIDALAKVSSLSDAYFAAPTNDTRLKAALGDCKVLFDDAIDQLNTSLASLQQTAGSGEKVLTASRVDDLRSWLSAAVTDQETCLDGFEGTTGGFREKMEAAMVNSTEFTSNSLAIVGGILGVMEKLNFPVHRKLLGVPDPDERRRAFLLEAELQANVTVAADGTGQVKTITEAVEMVPKKNAYPFVIHLKAGTYKENVVVDKSKWNVVLIGEGMYTTTITGDRNFMDGTPTFSTATFVAVGRQFMAKDIGFKNSAGPEKHQAVALRSGSDRAIFLRCYFDAYQDTLYAHSLRQFYKECDITGTVDFIFGDAAVVFQDCKIRPRQPLPNQQNTITAQGRKDPNENTGISIQSCTISPFDNITVPTYLGRPWKAYSRTVVMESAIGAVVNDAGWLSWAPGTVPPDTILYAEYQNTGLGSNVAGRVKWPGYKPAISAEEADKYTVDSFIKGSEWIREAGVDFISNL